MYDENLCSAGGLRGGQWTKPVGDRSDPAHAPRSHHDIDVPTHRAQSQRLLARLGAIADEGCPAAGSVAATAFAHDLLLQWMTLPVGASRHLPMPKTRARHICRERRRSGVAGVLCG